MRVKKAVAVGEENENEKTDEAMRREPEKAVVA